MTLRFLNDVWENTTTTGTGTVTLGGARNGYRSFATAVSAGDLADGDTLYYRIKDGLNWEVGLGTYASAGGTVARTTCYNSSSGGTTKITLSGGASIWCDVAASWFAAIASSAVLADAGSDTTCFPLVSGTQTGPIAALTSSKLTYNDAIGLWASTWLRDSGCLRVAANVDNATTTLATATGLSVSLPAGRSFSFEAFLLTSSQVDQGVKAAVVHSSVTDLAYEVLTLSGATIVDQSRAASSGTAGGATAVTAASVQIRGTITTNTVQTFAIQFAQNAHVDTDVTTVLRGSWLRLWDVP